MRKTSGKLLSCRVVPALHYASNQGGLRKRQLDSGRRLERGTGMKPGVLRVNASRYCYFPVKRMPMASISHQTTDAFRGDPLRDAN
jgi:hypothetical protein